jgi:hypothetical protein
MQKKNRPVITEAKLRRIIRDELARQYLVQEGFLDSLKNPFKKLGEKAKAAVLEKSDEILEKIKKVTSTLDPESLKKFFAAFKSQEGAVPLKELVGTIGFGDALKDLKSLGDVDMAKLAKGASVKEGFDVHEFRMSMILIEEEYNQKYGADVLNESILGAAAGIWWLSTKTFVSTCGLIVLVLKGVAMFCKFLGLDDLREYVIKAEHAIEKLEKYVLENVLFPKPVQYAAYRALHAAKMGISKAKGKETHEALKYDELFSEEGKEERKMATNGLKFAVIAAAIVQEIPHIFHQVENFVSSLKNASSESIKVAKDLSDTAVHAGKEGLEAIGTARTIAKAAEEIGPSAVKAAARAARS